MVERGKRRQKKTQAWLALRRWERAMFIMKTRDCGAEGTGRRWVSSGSCTQSGGSAEPLRQWVRNSFSGGSSEEASLSLVTAFFRTRC